jgi:hypothetical protein
MAQHREVLRRFPLADSAGIFVEGDIQGPVQEILNTPMTPHGMAKADSVIG